MKLILISTLVEVVVEVEVELGNISHFYMPRIYLNLRTFFNPENWLAEENNFFHVWDPVQSIEGTRLVLDTMGVCSCVLIVP